MISRGRWLIQNVDTVNTELLLLKCSDNITSCHRHHTSLHILRRKHCNENDTRYSLLITAIV